MSQNDDSTLDKFLSGKSSLSKIYQQGAKQQPPADLDAKILAQAQQAVQKKTLSASKPGFIARRPRWLVPASLAATLMLGINLAYNLKDISPDATHSENTAVIIDKQFEAKRQQAAKQRNQATLDSGSNTQASERTIQTSQAPPTIDTNSVDQDGASNQTSGTDTLANTSAGLNIAPQTPTMSAQPAEVNKTREELQASRITGSALNRAMPESKPVPEPAPAPEMIVEQETTQHDIAYAPEPATIAKQNDEAAPNAMESPDLLTEIASQPGQKRVVIPGELTSSRTRSAPIAEQRKNAHSSDNARRDDGLTEDSMASTAQALAGQSLNYFEDSNAKTPGYLCDLAAFDLSDAEIAEKAREFPFNEPRQTESVWQDLIVDIAQRGDYRQACFELAAFQKRYPNAKMPNDFPVRMGD